MKDLIKKGLALGLGLVAASKEQIEKVVDDLVSKGEVSAAESRDLVEELVKKGEQEQEELKSKVRGYLREILYELDLPSKSDLKSLESRIENLEKRE